MKTVVSNFKHSVLACTSVTAFYVTSHFVDGIRAFKHKLNIVEISEGNIN
jgi:hypothetical protein